MAEVRLEDVTKRFGSVTAVDGLDLYACDGEWLVVLGPSGCGKTTVLRLIAGLEHATFGRIQIGPRAVEALPPQQRNVAMAFQHSALYPHLDVRRNLAFGLKLRRTPRADIERRVQQAAQWLGLGDLLERRPWQLSGGQRQRVALGRVLVREPDVFLLDEPLSCLDTPLRASLCTELVRLQRQIGTTLLYVTHDQVEALTLGQRVAVLSAGRLQQLGTPQEIYDTPANRFVAEFVGSPPMNFLDGVLRGDATGLCVDAPALQVRLPLLDRQRYAPWCGRPVTLGIRPEAITVDPPADGASAWTAVRADIRLVQSLGADTILELDRGGYRFSVRAPPRRRYVCGDELEVYWQTAQGHLFDPASGVRL
jgi:multiple sugar transport system ATP-binding protein